MSPAGPWSLSPAAIASRPDGSDGRGLRPSGQVLLGGFPRTGLAETLELRACDPFRPGAWLGAHFRGRRLSMKAYVGVVDQLGLRWFFPEDVIPRDLLSHLVRSWLTRSTTAIWILVKDEDAEAVRADLSAGNSGTACNLLLNRAIELLLLTSVTPDLAR